MKAIVDCNSFYCSCERIFRPELMQHPVVVLSNNDGCIISQSIEAKAIGIQDIGPYHEAKPLIDQHDVAVFSSNYNLYGDMSRRVMETLCFLAGKENVEVYSVDEAFLEISQIPVSELEAFASKVKTTVEDWTGIKVSVGIAPTKTLAKVANRLAKKLRRKRGFVVLDTEEKIAAALRATHVGDVWGIGRKYAQKLEDLSITTAWDLYNMPETWVQKNMGGVVGVRLYRELHSKEAIIMEEYKSKRMISTTRMFGEAVTQLKDIEEAIATYVARAAEKLRRQKSAATTISIFVVSQEKRTSPHFKHGPTLSSYTILSQPTSLTNELIKPAVSMAAALFQEGKKYKKAGVTLSGLVPDSSIQASLFEEGRGSIGRYLMEMIDNVNFSMRGDVVKFASSGTKRDWKMRQQKLSPRYTTRWDELPEVG
jgi:DNA polymerase V